MKKMKKIKQKQMKKKVIFKINSKEIVFNLFSAIFPVSRLFNSLPESFECTK